MSKLAAIDLFCGVGGLTYGLKQAGIKVSMGVDIDHECKYAYEANNRDARFVHKDIRMLPAENLKLYFSDKSINVLVGCAPCQPFSTHTQKNKNRSKDEKWFLLLEFMRIVKGTFPTIISVENVPQIIKYELFQLFVSELESLGYFVSYQIVSCPEYGIPQIRKRMVLLASKLGEINLVPPTHTKENYVTVSKTIKGLPPVNAGGRCKQDTLHIAQSLSELNLKRIRNSKPGGSWRDWDKGLQLKCHKKESGRKYSAVYGRMSWDAPAPTITTQFHTYGTGRFGHPAQDRALTIREGALIQTFPRSYKFLKKNETPVIKKLGVHIGNAVPVKLAKVIGKSIIKHCERNGISCD